MSLQWEPQWEEEEVEYHGIRLRVPRDKVTGVYACPICGFGGNATYLFTVKDLVYHIYSHTRRLDTLKVKYEERGEEGGE